MGLIDSFSASAATTGVQAYDRYAFVNNNPVRHIDPSGHAFCQGYEGSCAGGGGGGGGGDLDDWYTDDSFYAFARPVAFDAGQYLGCGSDLECIDAAKHILGVSSWEYEILETLYWTGGPEAVHGVNHILAEGIRIKVGKMLTIAGNRYGLTPSLGGDWQTAGDIEGWFDRNTNSVYLNPNKGYSRMMMASPWGLATIIHEAKHLEQGSPLTKYKELQAWQIGFRVAYSLNYYPGGHIDPDSPTGKIMRLPLTADQANIDNFSFRVRQYSRGYWRFFQLLPDS